MTARAKALQFSVGMLFAGLARIPACSFSFVAILLKALALPVALYVVELFTWADQGTTEITAYRGRSWRKLLGMGGRAPKDFVEVCMGMDCFTAEWRVRRVSHLLFLANSRDLCKWLRMLCVHDI